MLILNWYELLNTNVIANIIGSGLTLIGAIIITKMQIASTIRQEKKRINDEQRSIEIIIMTLIDKELSSNYNKAVEFENFSDEMGKGIAMSLEIDMKFFTKEWEYSKGLILKLGNYELIENLVLLYDFIERVNSDIDNRIPFDYERVNSIAEIVFLSSEKIEPLMKDIRDRNKTKSII